MDGPRRSKRAHTARVGAGRRHGASHPLSATPAARATLHGFACGGSGRGPGAPARATLHGFARGGGAGGGGGGGGGSGTGRSPRR